MARDRLKKILSFALLGVTLVAIVYMADMFYEGTWEEVDVPAHRITSHSLGLHRQGETVRARVLIDEGWVKVLEGRFAIIQLLDSDNRASMEQGEGYTPLVTLEIDSKETDEGYIEYEAHRTDTYYLVYRNEDWHDLTLAVADGDSMDAQLTIKVFAVGCIIATLLIFSWAYGRYFEVNVRQRIGLVARPKGPGSRSAQEPRSPEVSPEDMVLEADGEGDGLLP